MASFTVTILDDTGVNATVTGDLDAETQDGGGLSLREALILANGNGEADDIAFDAALAGDTLLLDGSQLGITTAVTIDGDLDDDGTPDITVDAQGQSRVFQVAGGTSTIGGLVITGGDAGTANGGGITIAPDADLTLTNAVVSANRANFGGGIEVASNASLSVQNTTVSDNVADSTGGGILNLGTTNLTNTTVSGNAADFGGGGIENFDTAILTNTTVSGNAAGLGVGGGIYNRGTTELANTLVLGNAATTDPDVAGGYTDNGSNLVGGTPAEQVFAAIDPETGGGQLADNGGSTPTIALSDDPANPALDGGTNALALDPEGDPLATDQRGEGFERIVDGSVDIGAFEQQETASFLVTTELDVVDDTDGETSLREALALANADPTTADTITFVAGLAGSTILLTDGQLEIAGDLTIDGDLDDDGTPDITVDAQGQSRVFQVAGGTSTIGGLVITGGDAGTANGGGINVINDADLTLTNAVVSGNSAEDGGGLRVGDDASLSVTNTTVSDNAAGRNGGGIFNRGTAILTNTTVSGNAADSNGGGILNLVTATLTNATVSGNFAGFGGGIFNLDTAELANTLVLGNADSDGRPNLTGGYTDNGSNLVGGTPVEQVFAETQEVLDADGNGTDVFGGRLADNGGSTPTIALSDDPANPALDGGTNALALDPEGDPLATDQRGEGFERIVDGSVDIGAFEVQEDGQGVAIATTRAKPLAFVTEDGLPVAAVTAAPADGLLLLLDDGSLSYVPDPDFVGTDSFAYTTTGGSFLVSVEVTTPASVISGDGGPNTLNGGGGDDLLLGFGGNDDLSGSGGDDVLVGGDDEDELDGRNGVDVLRPGAGDGTLRGGSLPDLFVLESDIGSVTILDFTPNPGEDLLLAIPDFVNPDGSVDGSRLRVSESGGDTIVALDLANDGTFTAVATLLGVTGLSAEDLFANALTGTTPPPAEIEAATTESRPVAIDPGATVTSITTAAGDGTVVQLDDGELSYVPDKDFLGTDNFTVATSGGAVNVEVEVSLPANLINGGPDGETLNGTGGADTIDGRGGPDVLSGRADDDVLVGGGGADDLDGRSGADVLIPGSGAGTLRGGAATDLFVLETASLQTISDFNANQDDELLLVIGSLLAVDGSIEASRVRVVDDGGDALVQADLTDTGTFTTLAILTGNSGIDLDAVLANNLIA